MGQLAMQMPQRSTVRKTNRTESHTTSVNWQNSNSAFSTCTLSISPTGDDRALHITPPTHTHTRTVSPQSSC